MPDKRLWLDCDPGHDDATAILLAINIPGVKLMGLSIVHGNSSANNTFNNALRCLHAFGAPDSIPVHRGASAPLIRAARYDSEIHGVDGLAGVEGLIPADDPAPSLRLRAERSVGKRAVEGMAQATKEAIENDEKLTIIATGPLTNVALFVSVYPDAVEDGVEMIVFMGGGVGIGNRSPVAEFNILCDPEAAQVVLNAPIPTVMVPLNVTHTAILTPSIINRVLGSHPSSTISIPRAMTPLRHTLYTLLNHFAAAYAKVFNFTSGPPLHDALAVAYAASPELFKTMRYRVDVECAGAYTVGETVVDLWNYRNCDDSWGRNGKNCLVAESIDIDRFFDLFLSCISRCDRISPLNM